MKLSLLISCIALVFLPDFCPAEQIDIETYGAVLDPDEQIVIGAEIRFVHEADSTLSRSTMTDSDGKYELTLQGFPDTNVSVVLQKTWGGTKAIFWDQKASKTATVLQEILNSFTVKITAEGFSEFEEIGVTIPDDGKLDFTLSPVVSKCGDLPPVIELKAVTLYDRDAQGRLRGAIVELTVNEKDPERELFYDWQVIRGGSRSRIQGSRFDQNITIKRFINRGRLDPFTLQLDARYRGCFDPALSITRTWEFPSE